MINLILFINLLINENGINKKNTDKSTKLSNILQNEEMEIQKLDINKNIKEWINNIETNIMEEDLLKVIIMIVIFV
jgi:hypothetical protein